MWYNIASLIKERGSMSKFKRMHLVVLNSVGVGAAPDANNFVNAGMEHLILLGLSRRRFECTKHGEMVLEVFVPRDENYVKTVPITGPARQSTVSLGKDTMTGHWKSWGPLQEPFDTFWNENYYKD